MVLKVFYNMFDDSLRRVFVGGERKPQWGSEPPKSGKRPCGAIVFGKASVEKDIVIVPVLILAAAPYPVHVCRFSFHSGLD